MSLPKAGMDDVEREAKRAVAEIGMGHRQIAGREPWRQRQSQLSDLERVTDAAKQQRLVLDGYAQRHADAVADIFLKAGRTLRNVSRSE